MVLYTGVDRDWLVERYVNSERCAIYKENRKTVLFVNRSKGFIEELFSELPENDHYQFTLSAGNLER